MMEDIKRYDNPDIAVHDEPEAPPFRCHLCEHPTCPVWAADMAVPGWSEANGLIEYDEYDRFKTCFAFKPKALSAWNFLARMAAAASAVLIPCTIMQSSMWITVLLACSTVTFYSIWKWLEGKKTI